MLFEKIVGQKETQHHVLGMLNKNRMPHALLLEGPEGRGSFSLALAIAQYLLCESTNGSDACGSCTNCKQVEKLEHPDLNFSFPYIQEKPTTTAEQFYKAFREALLSKPFMEDEDWINTLDSNKQGQIGKAEAERILRTLNLSSFKGGAKVCIIWQPEAMNIAAANTLLKFIEEPTDNTYLIGITQKPDQILSTIYSRMQRIFIPELSEKVMTPALTEMGFKKKDVLNVLPASEGNLRKAQQLLENSEELKDFFDNFKHWMRICYKQDVKSIVEWIEDFAKRSREEQKQFVLYCLEFFRQSICANYVGDEEVKLMGDEKDFNLKFAPFINDLNIEELYEAMQEAHLHIERNANPKVLFLDLSFTVFKQFKKTKI